MYYIHTPPSLSCYSNNPSDWNCVVHSESCGRYYASITQKEEQCSEAADWNLSFQTIGTSRTWLLFLYDGARSDGHYYLGPRNTVADAYTG